MAPKINFLALRKAARENNERQIAETGLQAVFDAVEEAKPAPTPKPARAPRKSKATPPRKRRKRNSGVGSEGGSDSEEEVIKPSVGTRRSARAVQNTRTQAEIEIALAEKEVQDEIDRAAEQERKHGDRSVEALGGVTDSGDTASLLQRLGTLALYAKEHAKSPLAAGERPPAPLVDAEDYAELQESVNAVEHRMTVKVVPERIYSAIVHPDPTRDLVFVGDKGGHIGLWDATDAGLMVTVPADVEDDEEGAGEQEVESKGSFWHWKAHNRTISTLKIPPADPMYIYSSSYDCTIRRTNFETGMSEEVLDGDHWEEQDNLIHSFDLEPNGQVLWSSDNNGGITRRDMREPMSTARRWLVEGNKIGGISINPSNPKIAATAHLKRYMRIWDLGKLVHTPEDADAEQLEDCIITTTEHSNAVSSAYFDPSGTKILSTSYDDKLRVFDLDPWKLGPLKQATPEKPFKPSIIIPHNCQVGRYVSIFRAQWSPNPSQALHINIGNMKRMLSVYAPTGGIKGTNIAHLADDTITAVPAITASHPSLPSRYAGGNASGKITYFAPPRDED